MYSECSQLILGHLSLLKVDSDHLGYERSGWMDGMGCVDGYNRSGVRILGAPPVLIKGCSFVLNRFCEEGMLGSLLVFRQPPIACVLKLEFAHKQVKGSLISENLQNSSRKTG